MPLNPRLSAFHDVPSYVNLKTPLEVPAKSIFVFVESTTGSTLYTAFANGPPEDCHCAIVLVALTAHIKSKRAIIW
jgi:hypothetical protein